MYIHHNSLKITSKNFSQKIQEFKKNKLQFVIVEFNFILKTSLRVENILATFGKNVVIFLIAQHFSNRHLWLSPFFSLSLSSFYFFPWSGGLCALITRGEGAWPRVIGSWIGMKEMCLSKYGFKLLTFITTASTGTRGSSMAQHMGIQQLLWTQYKS
jgi:hypothetical protein